LSNVQELVDKFKAAADAAKTLYPKVNPLLVANLYFDNQADYKRIYTLEVILKRDQDTEEIRKTVVEATGMSPAFYLEGTKMIVSHPIDLEFLKRINDLDFVVNVKGSPYGAGGSTDF
jgi:hypothetical protein